MTTFTRFAPLARLVRATTLPLAGVLLVMAGVLALDHHGWLSLCCSLSAATLFASTSAASQE